MNVITAFNDGAYNSNPFTNMYAIQYMRHIAPLTVQNAVFCSNRFQKAKLKKKVLFFNINLSTLIDVRERLLKKNIVVRVACCTSKSNQIKTW